MTKYNAKKTTVDLADGTKLTFDSRKEAKRYKELAEMEQRGEIENLRLQVPYLLIPSQRRDDGKAERPCKYVADFVYKKDGKEIVEDTKGFKTPEYIIKRKLLLKEFGISLQEI